MLEGEQAGPGTRATRRRPRATLFRPAPIPAPGDGIPLCPYLARETPDRLLGPATGAVDPTHRCVALGDPVPQSSRQQELVCLTAAHVNCPRYLHGVQLAAAPPAAPAREPVSNAVIVAALVFLAAVAASFGFLAIRGGFDLAIETPPPGLVAAVPTTSAAPGASRGPAVSTPPTVSPSPADASSSPAPSASPSPSPSGSAAISPSPTPGRTPTPAPSSNRYAVLTPCPSTRNCWIYEIRSGDNLVSIANWFGVDYDRMRSMNPNLRIPIHTGDRLRIPTPTR